MAASFLREVEVGHPDRLKTNPRKTCRWSPGLISFAVFLFSGLGALSAEAEKIRYVAIGDSYTICEGVAEKDCWPSLLTKHLLDAGIDIELAANPSRTGWKVEDAINWELPVFAEVHPMFATLLIGVNDWVQGSGRNKFTSLLKTLMDSMREAFPRPERLLIITIPDFSCAPGGKPTVMEGTSQKEFPDTTRSFKKKQRNGGSPWWTFFRYRKPFATERKCSWKMGFIPPPGSMSFGNSLFFPRRIKF